MVSMPRFQINYQYREVEPTDQTRPIKGSVIWTARDISDAIDTTIAQLKADTNIVIPSSIVITAAKEVVK
jgi:hypothetical protein